MHEHDLKSGSESHAVNIPGMGSSDSRVVTEIKHEFAERTGNVDNMDTVTDVSDSDHDCTDNITVVHCDDQERQMPDGDHGE